MSASVLVSTPGPSFTVTQIAGRLDEVQELVGGYVEAVTLPDFHLYINEDGKATNLEANQVSTAVLDKYVPGFSLRDVLVGPVVWLGSSDDGGEADVPFDLIAVFGAALMRAFPTGIVVLRHDSEVWVYDTPQDGPVFQLNILAGKARKAAEHGVIEVYAAIPSARWVELRAELLNDEITLYDERKDRSFG